MAWTTFANLTSVTLPQFDGDFNALFNLSVLQCGIAGTNALSLTPTTNAPSFAAYSNNILAAGIAVNTNTGATTANVATAGAIPVYKDTLNGPAALIGGEIVAGNYIGLAYDGALNSGGGGFHLYAGAAAASLLRSLATGLTATGSTQGTALAITKDKSVFSTVAASTGAVLTNLGLGAEQWVFNRGANALLVYPSAGGQIDSLAVNAGYSLAAAKAQVFTQTAAGLNPTWLSLQLG